MPLKKFPRVAGDLLSSAGSGPLWQGVVETRPASSPEWSGLAKPLPGVELHCAAPVGAILTTLYKPISTTKLHLQYLAI